MPQSTYKGYELQVTGTNSGTWGSTLNTDVFTIIDNNLGAIVTKSLSSSNVTLSATESQALILRLTGTLSANVQVTTSCAGMSIVENLTSGAFSVTFTNGVSGVVIPQSSRAVVITDATNGARIGAASGFPSGTVMLFAQTSAPTGWTKNTSNNNNSALRLVTGSASTGGSVPFTTAFASQTPAGTIGDTTLTTNQIPAHTHELRTDVTYSSDGSGPNGSSPGHVMIDGAGGFSSGQFSSISSCIANAGGGTSHTHSFTGTAINLAVSYVDVIRATKD